jgi:hypothetical protein
MTATISKVPSTHNTNIHPDGHLRTQIGARVRLSEEERQLFKQAYRTACDGEVPSTRKVNSIRVETKESTPSLNKKLGMDSILFSQVINSRDPLPLPLLLRLQAALKVEIINRKELTKVYESYLNHIYNQAAEYE